MIEFVPWYHSGSTLLRCLSCAALLVSGDTEVHAKWHQKIEGN